MRTVWVVLGALLLIGSVGTISEAAAEIVAVILIAMWITSKMFGRDVSPDEERQRERVELHLHLKEMKRDAGEADSE